VVHGTGALGIILIGVMQGFSVYDHRVVIVGTHTRTSFITDAEDMAEFAEPRTLLRGSLAPSCGEGRGYR
jgi:hypothetical protein